MTRQDPSWPGEPWQEWHELACHVWPWTDAARAGNFVVAPHPANADITVSVHGNERAAIVSGLIIRNAASETNKLGRIG
jgi:hypothetical protein